MVKDGDFGGVSPFLFYYGRLLCLDPCTRVVVVVHQPSCIANRLHIEDAIEQSWEGLVDALKMLDVGISFFLSFFLF